MKVKTMRVDADLTQEQVADKLKITREAYRQKERGESEFKLSEVQKLAKIFNVPFENFRDIKN